MLLDIAFGSKTAWRILVLLASSPGKSLSRSEIREHTKLGNNPLTLTIRTLKVFKVLKEKKIGKTYCYSLDLTSEFVQDMIKIIENETKGLNNLPYRFSLVLREFIRKLMEVVVPEKVFLFGSVAKRTYREDSDIDVAVVAKKVSTDEKLRVTEILEGLEKRFKKRIQIHYFTEEEFENKKDNLVEEILRDGIKIV